MFKDEPKKNRDSRLYYPWRQKKVNILELG